MWTAFFRARSRRAAPRNRRRTFRPRLETLETRLAPSIVRWEHPVDGYWQDAGNWISDENPPQHRVPGPGDDAVVSFPSDFTVYFNGDNAAKSLGMNNRLVMEGGTLTVLNPDGQSSNINASLDVQAGAALRVENGRLNTSGAITLAGTLDAAAPTAAIVLGSCAAPNSIEVNDGAALTGLGQYVESGCIVFNVNVPFTLPDNFELDGTLAAHADVTAGANYLLRGIQRGAASVIVPDGSVLTLGDSVVGTTTIGPGTLEIQAGGTMNVVTAGRTTIVDAVLNNAGTITVTAAATVQVNDSIPFLNPSTINNLDGGLVDFQTDNQLTRFNPPDPVAFNNAGVVRKTGGAGVSNVNLPFNNTGRVEAAVGTLQVTTGTNSGTLDVAEGAVFQFGAITPGYTLADGTQLTGSGLFRVSINLSVEADVSVGRLEVTNPNFPPSLNVAGSLTVTTGLDFLGGSILGSGHITIAEDAALTLAGGGRIDDIALDNFGTATITVGYTNPTNRFVFTNYGAVIVSVTGQQNLAGRFTNLGSFFKFGNGVAGLNGPGFSNDGGYVGLYEGRLVLAPHYVQTDGVTEMAAGTVLQATVDLQGGYLVGAGTIVGNVTNNGWIEVGGFGATGVLTVQGNYVQTADGVLSIELGGTDPGAFDQLVVTGRATLDGTLVVSYLPDYAPNPGDFFPVLTFASRQGDFAFMDLPDGLSAGYNASSLTLGAS